MIFCPLNCKYKVVLFVFINSCLYFAPAYSQDLLNLIADCSYVRGKVASTQINTTYFSADGSIFKTNLVRKFDADNRIIFSKKTNEQEQLIEQVDYFYHKNLLKKIDYNTLSERKSLYFQYYKQSPLKILEVSPDKQLLSISQVLMDSLWRPIVLKNYDLKEKLQFIQTVQYNEKNTTLLSQYKYIKRKKQKKQPTYTYEYTICPEDLFATSIKESQFENNDTKVLNLRLDNQLATIVKAVKQQDGNEDIYIQEITFDKKGNWVQDNLYRLKKRKQTKILVQETTRTIVYR